MGQTEDVIILKVGTDEAVKSIGDLKTNIKALKGDLEVLEVGTEEYQSTLKELQQNQNALKDAMYATTGTMEDVAAAAKGTSQSYNSLVNQMATLKKEWRATNNEVRRNELGQQIFVINQELKDMDASIGNFQRNVGNYESGFSKIGEVLKGLPPTLGSAKEQLGKIGETMQIVGKQPILGIIGLLAPIIMKIVEALRENETAMGAVKKIMDLMQPAFDFLNGILENIAQGFANLVGKIANLVGGNGWFNKVIESVIGVGNVLLQRLLAPIKSIIAAFKGLGNIMKSVFSGDFKQAKEDAKNAWEEIKNAYVDGFSIKKNFKAGKEWGQQFVAGISSTKPEAKAEAENVSETAAKEVSKPIKREKKKIEAIRVEQVSAEEAFSNKMKAEAQKRMEAEKEEHDLQERNKEARKKLIEERLAETDAVAGATSNLLSSLADMYESEENGAQTNAKKIKALRIASATIDMFQGAVTAFTSAQELGVPLGPIVGAVNAAAVVAMGIANINKIKSTNVDNPSENGGGATPVTISPPSVNTSLPSVRNVTSASEEDRLNRMASDQKVYILQSDIEAAGHQSKVQVAETSF